MVNSSKLKITRTEVFFDELPDIICLGVYSKSLDLKIKRIIWMVKFKSFI